MNYHLNIVAGILGLLALTSCKERVVFEIGEFYSGGVNQTYENAHQLNDQVVTIDGFLVLSTSEFETPIIVQDRKTFEDNNFTKVLHLEKNKSEIMSCDRMPVSINGHLKKRDEKVLLDVFGITLHASNMTQADFESLGLASLEDLRDPDCKPIVKPDTPN